MIAHAERKHALLGASGAARWIACPPSARLTEHIVDKGSEYADEGNLAHELSEVKLERRLLICNAKRRKELDTKLAEIHANDFYGPEMEHAITEYCEFVEERYMEACARSKDAIVLLEAIADFTEWVPDGKGIGDVVIIADGIMEVIDLKYGKGVPVSAYGNPQIRLYALGSWAEYSFLYDIHEVRMTIVQPRLDSITTEIMSVDELVNWAEEIVKPAAFLADAGEGEFKAGEHCRWCKVKGNCRARADESMKALAYEFQDPALLSLEEVGSILTIAEQLKKWAGDIEEFAFDQAVGGNRIPGWKLVEGRSNRSFIDIEAVKVKLIESGFKETEILKPQALLGITDLETKVIGKKKFKELLNELVVKPQGKPVLVVETDPRQEMNSVEEDFAGEEFDG